MLPRTRQSHGRLLARWVTGSLDRPTAPIWAQTFRKGFDVDPGLTPHPQKIILS